MVTESMVTTIPFTSGFGASTSSIASVPVLPVVEPQPTATIPSVAASSERRTGQDICNSPRPTDADVRRDDELQVACHQGWDAVHPPAIHPESGHLSERIQVRRSR